MNHQQTRYAIYYAPDPHSPLWRFGSECLGYDAFLGEECNFFDSLPLSQSDWIDLTQEPRRYGFHATLKAPFTLKPDFLEKDLINIFDEFVSRNSSVWLTGLQISCLNGFVALLPTSSSEQLQDLANKTVLAFENIRAELSPEDMERRLKSPLTERQANYLRCYGYPYVMDEFRFHMTLTDRMPLGQCANLANLLQDKFDSLVKPGPLKIDQIAIFKQDNRNARFRIIHSSLLS